MPRTRGKPTIAVKLTAGTPGMLQTPVVEGMFTTEWTQPTAVTPTTSETGFYHRKTYCRETPTSELMETKFKQKGC
jgi:hypothetical protein